MIRAQEAMNHNEEIIRVGISPMTPPEVFVELWPKIQKIYPEMKFKLITFEIHQRMQERYWLIWERILM